MKTYEGSDEPIMPVEHLCHAKGCKTPVPPKLFMCQRHWFTVPRPLRQLIWKRYRPGQEIDKRPTREYMKVAQQAIDAVAKKEEEAAARKKEREQNGI